MDYIDVKGNVVLEDETVSPQTCSLMQPAFL
jgi:hypothetical protein